MSSQLPHESRGSLEDSVWSGEIMTKEQEESVHGMQVLRPAESKNPTLMDPPPTVAAFNETDDNAESTVETSRPNLLQRILARIFGGKSGD